MAEKTCSRGKNDVKGFSLLLWGVFHCEKREEAEVTHLVWLL